ncbi:MAG: hypothetical protein V7K98_14200 [Nostoc sp.]|uniref:hypothetical protein n=1 Tax=Nostoc sp. TaxID=1180 RepID=UPI002FFA8A65
MGHGEGSSGSRINNQFPILNSQFSMPHSQIRAILSLPAKIVAIVTKIVWQ